MTQPLFSVRIGFLSESELGAFENIAVGAARLAAKVILQSMDRIDRLEIKEKSPLDFVTSVDHQAEEVIIERLRKAFPDHGILAEESGFVQGDDKSYCWVIDPLDGTTNYIRQIPHFAISIALLHSGRPICAVVYDPVKDELFTANKGRGSYCNQRRLRVNKLRTAVKGSYMAIGGPVRRDQATWFEQLAVMDAIVNRAAGIRRMGSAALDLAYVAAGRCDGYWGVQLSPWDFRAGELLINEAGGLLCDFEGSSDFTESGNILAGNPKLLHDLLQVLQKTRQTSQDKS